MATAADNNIALVSGYIAKQSGVGFYNEAILVPNIDTQHSDEYGTKSGGARVGNTIRVKRRAQFVATDTVTDPSITANTVQAIEEDTVVLKLDFRPAVHGEIDTEQATLEIEANGGEYSDRVLQPMGKALAAKIESYGFEKLAKFAQNTVVYEDNTGDVAFDSKILRKKIVAVRGMLDKQLAPKGDRFTCLGTDAELEVSDSVLALFHSNKEIETAYEKGEMGTFGGLKWLGSDLIYTRVNGAGGLSTTVSAFSAATPDQITLTSVANVKVGDKIQWTTNFFVNPETKIAYATKLQRAVKAIAGNVITIDPIYGPATSGLLHAGKQNASLLPVATQAVTILGTAGETYMCIPVWQKMGITLGSADLYLPKSVEMSARNKVLGVSQRFIRDYQIGSDLLPNRYESLLNISLLYPEFCGVMEWRIS
jgi:hypothetical protein